MGWFETLLLAKNFSDAALMLRYHQAITASLHAMRREREHSDFDVLSEDDLSTSLEYEAIPVLTEILDTEPRGEAKRRGEGSRPRLGTVLLSLRAH